MRSIPAHLQRIIGRVLVPALLVWLGGGGAGLLNCCAVDAETRSSHRQDASNKFSEVFDDLAAASCASEQGHCRKAKGRVSAPAYTNLCNARGHLNGLMSCCSPFGQAADRARKSRIVPERADSPTINDEQSAQQRVARTGSPSFFARVGDQSRTYLRDCVFLI